MKQFYMVFTSCLLMSFVAQAQYSFKIQKDVVILDQKSKNLIIGTDFTVSFDKPFPKGFKMKLKLIDGDMEKEKLDLDSASVVFDSPAVKVQPPSAGVGHFTYTILVKQKLEHGGLEISFWYNDNRLRIRSGSELINLVVIDIKKSIAGPVQPDNTTKTKAEPKPGECDISDPDRYYFIPPTVSYPGAGDNKDCLFCRNDYSVVYDLSQSEPKLCYFKRKVCKCKKSDDDATRGNSKGKNCDCSNSKSYCYKPKKRIRPWVGQNIGFYVFGYYSSFDSLGIGFKFESKNLELRDAFAKAITPPSATPQEGKQEVKPDSAAAPVSNDTLVQLEKDSTFFAKMKSEFIEYYSYLTRNTPAVEVVSADITYINAMLNQYCIKVKEFSPKGLVIAVGKHLDEFKAEGQQAEEITKRKLEITKIVIQASLYYGSILNYRGVKIPVVQVENEDQLQWTMDFYKNKKLLSNRLYSFMITGGWKIDFSSGFVFNKLIDRQYVRIDTKSVAGVDSVSMIKQQNNGKYTADIGLLAHAYPRTGTRVNVGLTTGLIVRSGSSIKYILGGSILLGYEQRFIVSGGVVGGTVKVLDGALTDALDNNVPSSRFGTTSTISTIDQWKWEPFFAISYNLGGTTISTKTKGK